ncbi:MAG: YbhB/YbcL family Raf kinase inhibitor-like protein [Methanomassiliicoccales archaeon]|nr:YbhB/YbcL family Raf kinase inhibitor-like protein [Methanomassiliicoccales archaeon]NYT16275.1 YbhB/YbcL family Raf kinase inhibitor-like protein [Methanomassiliicoccales archaeon]
MSNAFGNGEAIPSKFTCDGLNISPPLKWSEIPAEAKVLVLICEDIDAPVGTITHWVIYGIDPGLGGIEEGLTPNSDQSIGIHGRRSFGKREYMGPCPPGKKAHRYVFKLYALDRKLDLEPGVKKKNLVKAMEGHVIETSELIGTYTRQK